MTAINSPIKLITIPVSHYCEKVRWALNRANIPFIEEPHMPPFHRVATRKFATRSANSSVIQSERKMSFKNQLISRIVGGQSVPVLITQLEILTDSAQILYWVDSIADDNNKLYPINPADRQQVEDFVNQFDSLLAPAVRQWFYAHTFNRPDLIKPLWCQGVPKIERMLFPVVFRWMRSNISQTYTINSNTILDVDAIISQVFQTVETKLSDGRKYLVNDRFSAADLTFATLAAAMVSPKGYGAIMPELDQLPITMANRIRELRETIAGKFVLRLYEEQNSRPKSGSEGIRI